MHTFLEVIKVFGLFISSIHAFSIDLYSSFLYARQIRKLLALQPTGIVQHFLKYILLALNCFFWPETTPAFSLQNINIFCCYLGQVKMVDRTAHSCIVLNILLDLSLISQSSGLSD